MRYPLNVFLKRWVLVNLEIMQEFFCDKRGLIILKNASYAEDGMVSANYAGFLDDPVFRTAYIENSKETFNSHSGSKNGTTRWRSHIVCWAFNQAKFLEGDLLEFGVYYGHLMATACDYHKFQNWDKTLFLIDTWGENSHYDKSNRYSQDIFEEVKLKFSKYHNVKLIRGFVPEVLNKIKCKKISFISLDMNCGMPEHLVLKELWDRMVPGSIVYLDDYGDLNHANVQKEIDIFFSDKNETILCFPNKVAIVVKTS